MTGQPDRDALARILDKAAADRTAVPQLTATHPFSLDDAYAIQQRLIALRVARGETRTGIKMGFTSREKMQQMGVDEMIWGSLTSGMLVEDGGSIALDAFLHPRAEPEVAFLLKRPLSGPVSPAQAMAAVEAVAPAIEVIDSRYRDFRFTLEDVVADNCSASAYVLGGWNRPDVDLDNLGMLLEFNGRPVGVGSSAAILGHPARALAAAARLLGAAGRELEAGWVVMAGSATAAQPLTPGLHVRCTVQHLGRADLYVGPEK